MDRSVQPKIESLREIKIPFPERFRLSNGIPITIVNAGHQDVIRFDVLFKAGTWCQSQKLQALFTNRMLREGTKEYSAKEIAETLDFYGAWLELSCGAEYSCITLFSLSRHFTKTLNILYSVITEPLFEEERLETVIEMNVQQFVINQDRVDFVAHRNLLNALLGNTHPYGRVTAKEDYLNITASLLKEYHNEHFHSENCTIFLSGNVTADIRKEVDAVFGKEHFGREGGKPTECPKPVFSPATEKRRFIKKNGALQSAVCMGMPTIKRTHPDYHRLRVLLTLFGGYFGSRLVSNIREDKGYTYYIDAEMLHYPFSDYMLIHSECDNQYVEDLIQQVYNEMNLLRTELAADDEIIKVKNYMIGEMCRNYESAFEVSDAWMFVFTSKVADSYFKESLEGILATTPEDVMALANKYFSPELMKEVVVGHEV